MRIGELSARTRVTVRMLRYYEERGLLTPERAPSGYRRYQEDDVQRATLVSSLIRSGLPTKLIVPLLRDATVGDIAEDGLTDLLRAEMARLDARIDCMTLSRAAIARHLRDREEAGATDPRPAG